MAFNLKKNNETEPISKNNPVTSSKIDLSKSSQSASAPIKKESNFKNAIWIVLVVLICFLGWFLFLKADSGSTVNTDDKLEKADSSKVERNGNNLPLNNDSENINSKEILVKGESETIGTSINTSNVSSPPNSVLENESARNNSKAVRKLSYRSNEMYKIYQFPYGDGTYSQANPELDKLVMALQSNPEIKIKIFAYTDNKGSVQFNQGLSEKRAKAIFDYIKSKGINSDRLSYQGKGISTKYGSDEENRRAEFVLGN